MTDVKKIKAVVVKGKFHLTRDKVFGPGDEVDVTPTQLVAFADSLVSKADYGKVTAEADAAKAELKKVEKTVDSKKEELALIEGQLAAAKAELAKAEAGKKAAAEGEASPKK